MPDPRHMVHTRSPARRLLVRLLVAVGILVGLVFAGALAVSERNRQLLGQIFGSWLSGQALEHSQGAWRVSAASPRLDWFRRSVWLDSIVLHTRDSIPAADSAGIPRLDIVLHRCAIAGLAVFRLARGRGLHARSFGCDSARVVARIPPPREAPRIAAPAPRSLLALQHRIRLPDVVPRIRIREVHFPAVAARLVQHRWGGARAEFALARLDWRIRDLVLDPADSSSMNRLLFSRAVDLSADSIAVRPSGSHETRVARLLLSLTDSTMELRGFSRAPVAGATAPARGPRVRFSRVLLAADRVRYQGIDLRALLAGRRLAVRRIDVDSLRIEVLRDKSLPARPERRERRTPQEWVRDVPLAVRIDTLVVRNGHVLYRERKRARSRPGELSFSEVEALATGLRHEPGRASRSDTMKLHASSLLMAVAPFEAEFLIPLDAPSFDAAFAGQLGRMEVAHLNALVGQITPTVIRSGVLDSLTFHAVVRNGVASGEAIPRYRNFALDVTGEGEAGLLGDRGLVGDVARGVAEFVANTFTIRSDNPSGGEPAETGVIHHVFQPEESVLSFFWSSIWAGIKDVVER